MLHYLKKITFVALLVTAAAPQTWAQNSSTSPTESAESAPATSTPSASGTGTSAAADKAETSNNAVLSGISGGANKFRFQGFATHIPKIRRDQGQVTTTDIMLRGDYNINKNQRVRVQQSMTKRYEKVEHEYEFMPSDTILAHFYRFDERPAGISLQWRTGFHIPISNASHRDDLYTRITGSLIGLKPFFGGKVLAIGIPFARYSLNRYKTSVSGRQLPLYTLGMNATVLYMVTNALSLAVTGGYNFQGRTRSQFDQLPQQPNNGTYRFDLDVSYQVTSNWSASIGYSQGANYMQDGRYELNLFDSEISRYYLMAAFVY